MSKQHNLKPVQTENIKLNPAIYLWASIPWQVVLLHKLISEMYNILNMNW